jgi:hypothetical protein
VRDRARLGAVADRLGARLVVEDIASRNPGVHDAQKLASAYARLMETA